MDPQPRPDDLALLRAEFATRLAAQDAAIDRLKRRKGLPRRFLPLALAALLVALVPLATLAASPFNDLTGGVHDANIGLIYDAGITKGCVPNVSYCPTGNVTREEMASFLARTAGLGDNPPVVNAKTAVSAQTATNATQLGGKPASAYVPANGAFVTRISLINAVEFSGNSLTFTNQVAAVTIQRSSAGSGDVVVPLNTVTEAFGVPLRVQAVQICYQTQGNARISATQVSIGESFQDGGLLYSDTTIQPGITGAGRCYTVIPTSQPGPGVPVLRLGVSFGSTSDRLYLYSAKLTLSPTPGAQP